MSGFGEATAVRRTGEGRYAVALDGDFGFEQALNGGYLMAVLARAALDASGRPYPISTAASFLRVAKPGPAEVLVETRKSGRTAEVARVSLVQDEAPIVDALITTGALDGDAEPLFSEVPGRLPAIEECVTFGGDKEDGFTARIDMRYDPATMGWLDGRPGGRPEMRSYFRLREAYEPDGVLLALAVDALPPVVLNTGRYGWSPTVELTWHMRAVPAPGPLALYGSGRLVSDGWFDEDVEVWDAAGRLVAQSRQIARAGRRPS
ncbi:thioesterase family protein [Actinoallomurus sp. NBC_01490]|uniref:thioesterase family protein n=1 Tax=Actinoallomurus sp. NBC_01490 TaxID=2903557 RepID=UPI002E322C3C|nr:thioesterase family protein [Actinoallomurus sp. NBC_01490]